MKNFLNSATPASLIAIPGQTVLHDAYQRATLAYFEKSNEATSYDDTVATRVISARVSLSPAANAEPVKKVSKNSKASSIFLNFSGSAGALAKTCG